MTATNTGERSGAQQVLKQVKHSNQKISGLTSIWVDGAFDGQDFMRSRSLRFALRVMDFCRWIIQVVLRPEHSKGFVLLKKRWVVERTFG